MGLWAAAFSCLLFATVLGAQNLVELRTDQHLVASYHKHVDLHCNISSQSSQDEFLIKNMFWVSKDKEKLCHVHDGKLLPSKNHGVKCHYVSNKQLTLTLKHMKPTLQGEYNCTVLSNHGMKKASAALTMREYFGDVQSQVLPSTVTCRFSSVYPKGKVHWFDNDGNVMESSTGLSAEPNQDGTFNVYSSLNFNDMSRTYNCSLWIPSTRTYLHSHQINWPSTGRSSKISGAAFVHTAGLGCVLMLFMLLLL